MICTFGYVTNKSNSEAASAINELFKKNFKKIYKEDSASVVDRNPISCKVIASFDCHFTDIRKIEEKFLDVIVNNCSEYPNIRFMDEYDTYNIVYEIKNPEKDNKEE